MRHAYRVLTIVLLLLGVIEFAQAEWVHGVFAIAIGSLHYEIGELRTSMAGQERNNG